jgi:tetratricopeptide (TPR) repeat protein
MFDRLASGGLDVPGVRVAAPDASFRDQPKAIPSDVRDKLVAALTGAVGLINPIAGLLVSMADLGAALVKKWRETPVQDLRPHAVLFETLRAATSSGPTLLLFEDITGPGRELIWQILLYQATWTRDRRLLVVVGADGPPAFEPRDGRDPLDGFPPVLKQVREAVSANRATWHWLPFLDLNRVTDWVGAVDPDIGQQLIAVSGGDDKFAARNWARWVSDGYVRRDHTGRWVLGGSGDPIEGDVFDTLATRLLGTDAVDASIGALELGRQMLEYASLSGTSFSLAAVAKVLSDDRGDVTARQVEELGDLLRPHNGEPWLMDTCGNAEIPVGGQLTRHWLYRFVSTELAVFLKAAWPVANNTGRQNDAAIHEDHCLFYPCCYQLARTAGDAQAAGKYSSRIAADARRQQLTVRADLLLSVPDDKLVLAELVQTANDLLVGGKLGLAALVGERSQLMADRIGSTNQQATASHAFGRILDWSGQHALAIPPLDLSVRLWRALVEGSPGDMAAQEALVVALSDIGVAYRNLRRMQESIDALEEAVRRAERLLELAPGNARAQRNLALRRQDLGVSYEWAMKWQEAIDALREAIGLFGQLHDADPESPEYQRDLGVAYGALGSAYTSSRRPREALAPLAEAVRWLQGLLEADPGNRDIQRQLCVRLENQGSAYTDLGLADQAVKTLDRAVALRQELFIADPAVVDNKYRLAMALGSRGVAYRGARQVAESIESLEKALGLYRELIGSDPADVSYRRGMAIRLADLGKTLHMAGQYETSKQRFDEALEMIGALVQSDPENTDFRHIFDATSSALEQARRHTPPMSQ